MQGLAAETSEVDADRVSLECLLNLDADHLTTAVMAAACRRGRR
jgi:hypothetical protein